MKKLSCYWAIGVTAILGGTACSSADLDQTGAVEIDGDTQVTQDDGGTGCGRVSEPDRLSLEWLDSADELRSVGVFNPTDADGVVSLTQTVISEDGATSTELAKLPIGAGESLVVPVPALDPSSGTNPSSLHVTGTVDFADGSRGWDSVKSGLVAGRLPHEKALVAPPITTLALVTKRYCFRYPGSFGADQGEDYMEEGVPTLRPARGMRVEIDAKGAVQHEFVLDRDGCSPAITLGTQFFYGVSLYTEGEIDNAELTVIDVAQSSEVQRIFDIFAASASTSTQTVDLDPTGTAAEHAANVFQAAAWTLRRVWESGSDALTIRVNDPTSRSNYRNGVVRLEAGDEYDKWTIAHEIGHWVMDAKTDGPGGDCSYGGDTHGRYSIEYQSCALSEGFANHISATAFNLTGYSNCSYSGVDCDQGLTTGGSCRTKNLLWTRVMENCASDPSALAGLGNETDWSRVLWNMRAPATGLGTTQLTDWIRTANDRTAWTDENVYVLLNSRANAIGGTLNSLFDAHKSVHGIDW